jgi:hypothetical protein
MPEMGLTPSLLFFFFVITYLPCHFMPIAFQIVGSGKEQEGFCFAYEARATQTLNPASFNAALVKTIRVLVP